MNRFVNLLVPKINDRTFDIISGFFDRTLSIRDLILPTIHAMEKFAVSIKNNSNDQALDSRDILSHFFQTDIAALINSIDDLTLESKNLRGANLYDLKCELIKRALYIILPLNSEQYKNVLKKRNLRIFAPNFDSAGKSIPTVYAKKLLFQLFNTIETTNSNASYSLSRSLLCLNEMIRIVDTNDEEAKQILWNTQINVALDALLRTLARNSPDDFIAFVTYFEANAKPAIPALKQFQIEASRIIAAHIGILKFMATNIQESVLNSLIKQQIHVSSSYIIKCICSDGEKIAPRLATRIMLGAWNQEYSYEFKTNMILKTIQFLKEVPLEAHPNMFRFIMSDVLEECVQRLFQATK